MTTQPEWKPGDVAKVLCSDGKWRTAIHYLYMGQWTWAFGDSTFRDADTSEARPLVVIDPEDRGQIERLRNLTDAVYDEQNGLLLPEEFKAARGNALQTALRSLVTPPKPPEPTGLGAVVEDEDGVRWTRTGPDAWNREERASGAAFLQCFWVDVAAVKVLSEGVPA